MFGNPQQSMKSTSSNITKSIPSFKHHYLHSTHRRAEMTALEAILIVAVIGIAGYAVLTGAFSSVKLPGGATQSSQCASNSAWSVKQTITAYGSDAQAGTAA